jgi:hypothetical protein
MICVSNYRRPAALAKTLAGWCETTPSYIPITVLSNTTQDIVAILAVIHDIQSEYNDRKINHIVDETRQPGHWGCLAESWNTLIQVALRHEKWVIL